MKKYRVLIGVLLLAGVCFGQLNKTYYKLYLPYDTATFNKVIARKVVVGDTLTAPVWKSVFNWMYFVAGAKQLASLGTYLDKNRFWLLNNAQDAYDVQLNSDALSVFSKGLQAGSGADTVTLSSTGEVNARKIISRDTLTAPVWKSVFNWMYFVAGAKQLASLGTYLDKNRFWLLNNAQDAYDVEINSDEPSWFKKGFKIGAGAGGGDTLTTYKTGTMACTTKTSDFSSQTIKQAYYTKIGNVVTISWPSFHDESASNTFRIYCSLPYVPKQKDFELTEYENIASARISVGSAIESGYIEISGVSTSYVSVKRGSNGNFSTYPSTKTLYAATSNYIAED